MTPTERYRVVVTDENVWPWLDGLDERLDPRFVPLSDRDRLRAELRRAWAYVGVHLDADLAAAVDPELALVQIDAAGIEHVAIDALPAGIPVANAFGHGRSVVEHVLMVVLAARRRLLQTDRHLRAGRWFSRLVDADAPRFRTLDGATIGVVGLGHIGRSIAHTFHVLGARVIALRARTAGLPDQGDPEIDWIGGPGDLDRLLEESDVLVLACPLTALTRGMIGAEQLRRLGRQGVLVNVARGPVVDEKALYDALRAREIDSAALDVWYRPVSPVPGTPSDYPFAELDNVIMTPHYSATADDTYRERARDVIDDLHDALAGRTARHLVAVSGGGAR